MQVEAILRAAHNLYEEDGVTVTPEIMIPLSYECLRVTTDERDSSSKN